MRVKGATVQQFLLALALLAGVCWNLAEAAELRGVDLRSGATGTRAELRLDREAAYQLISLSAPERLVVDLTTGVSRVDAGNTNGPVRMLIQNTGQQGGGISGLRR